MGVQRQYSGTAGRIENCQIGVFLAYASEIGHTLIDRALYLPKCWLEDTERRRKAGIPEEVIFATKPELAAQMVKRLLESGISVAWVTGDTVYGSNPGLRTMLEERRQAYALAVSCQERVEVAEERQRVDQLASEVTPKEWKRMSAGEGCKGPRFYDWTSFSLSQSVVEGWARWLVIRRDIPKGAEVPNLAFFLVFARPGTTLKEMVQVIGKRWTIEQCFELGKGEVGLDEYEIRSWQGWYRHVTLCLLAQAFLTILQLHSERNEPHHDEEKAKNAEELTQLSETAQPMQSQADLGLPMMVPLSLPEVRRLFYYLVGTRPFSFPYRLTWSYWRRTHQAIARLCHYRRRVAAQLQL